MIRYLIPFLLIIFLVILVIIITVSQAFNSDQKQRENDSKIRYLAQEDPYIQDKRKRIAKIPKIIHQIWVGPREIPSDCQEYQRSWIKMCQESHWKYQLWTDNDLCNGRIQLKNQKEYDQAKQYAQKADLLRFELLNQFGGFYIDMDVEYLKNFDHLRDSSFVIGVELEDNRKQQYGTAIIGSVPHYPILTEILETMPQLIGKKKCITEETGPAMITPIVNKYLDWPSVRIEPLITFYPYNWTQKKPDCYDEKTLAVHHWKKSWH